MPVKQGNMTFTAVIHYKTAWLYAQLYHSKDGGEVWDFNSFSNRTSPIGPGWIVLNVSFQHEGLLFVLRSGHQSNRSWDNPAPDCPETNRRNRNYFIADEGTYVLANGVLTKFSSDSCSVRDSFGAEHPKSSLDRNRPRLALFVDIDRTLFGGDGLLDFLNCWERKLALSGAVLILNTGRSITSVLRLLKKEPLMPIPTASVCKVGCSVSWHRTNGYWLSWTGLEVVEDEKWSMFLSKTSDWDASSVYNICETKLCREIDMGASFSETQEKILQGYVVHLLVLAEKVQEAKQILEKTKLRDNVKYAISGYGMFRHLDVIHEQAGKLGGMRYVLKELGRGFSPETTVMAGDSGNDLDALDHDGQEKGIIVGNAQEELVQWWTEFDRKNPLQKRVVKTKAHFARGILEGLATFDML